MNSSKPIFDFLRALKSSSAMKVTTNTDSFFADRLTHACTEQTLLDMAERLCKSLDVTIDYLGKKRAHGLGKIVSVEVDRIDEDRSITWQGTAMRWLPDDTGTRLVRLRPPYWNRHERICCGEIGAVVAHQ